MRPPVFPGFLLLLTASGCPSRFDVQGYEASGSTSTPADTETHANTTVSDSTTSGEAGCVPVGAFPSYKLETAMQVHAGGDTLFNDDLGVGDFNGDGVPDVAVAWWEMDGEFGVAHLTRFLGTGAGALGPALTISPEDFLGGFGAVVVTQLDGDGLDDLVFAAGQCGEPWLCIGAFLGNTDGGLTISDSLTAWPHLGIYTLATADVGANGRSDIIFTGVQEAGNVGIVASDGGGGLAWGVSVGLLDHPRAGVAADLDGDSLPEIIVVTASNLEGDSGPQLHAFTGTATGFGAQKIWSLPDGAGPIALIDVDADERPDVVVLGDDGLQIFATQADGDLVFAGSAETTGWSPVVADFNADGYDDLALLTSDGATILAGNGCSLELAATLPLSGAWRLSARDMNGSGLPDLVVMTSQSVEVYLAGNHAAKASPSAWTSRAPVQRRKIRESTTRSSSSAGP